MRYARLLLSGLGLLVFQVASAARETKIVTTGLVSDHQTNATQSEAKRDFADLARLIQRTKDRTSHQSGTAIAVIKDGRILYEGYFGFADIQNKIPVDRSTAFYLASATKPFLALNTLLLANQGKLNTHANLPMLFPKLAFRGFDAKAITIGDLLTHTSGIDNQPLVWATALSGVHNVNTRYALIAQSMPNQAAAHGKFDYTNVGYNILSVWLDRKFQTPWQRQLRANIFQPLGMTHTSAYISEAHEKAWPLAKPYSVLSAHRNVPLYLKKADSTMQAAGGLVATAPDVATFLTVQLTLGKLNGKQALPRSVINASQQQQTATDGAGFEDFKRTGYAWGWYIGEYKGKHMLHHFGGFAGFHAHLSFIPEANIGLVILNNEDFLAAKVSNLIADYVYGQLLGQANNNAKVAVRFDELLEKAKGLDAAVAAQQAKIDARKWDLSLPMKAYAGRYTHALLGEIRVELNADGKLHLYWGQLRAHASPYDMKDHARVEFVPNSGQVIEFVVHDKKVTAVRFEQMEFIHSDISRREFVRGEASGAQEPQRIGDT
jgi:CubicO group peptidase (beta-lactamase class C family)